MKYVFYLFCLLVLISLLSCSGSINYQNYLDSGMQFQTMRLWEDAENEYNMGLDASRKEDNHIRASIFLNRLSLNAYLAENYNKSIRYSKESISEFEQANTTGNDAFESNLMNQLGRCYFALGEYSSAKKYFILASEKSQHETSYGNIGAVYHMLGNLDEAIKYYKKVLLNGGDGFVFHNLSLCLKQKGNYELAQEYFHKYEKYCENEPDKSTQGLKNCQDIDTDPFYGDIALATGRKSKAFDIYSKIDSKIGLASYYQKNRNYKKSTELYLAALGDNLEIQQTLSVYINLGLEYEEIGDLKKSQIYYNKAVAKFDEQLKKISNEDRDMFLSVNPSGKIWPPRSEAYLGLKRVFQR